MTLTLEIELWEQLTSIHKVIPHVTRPSIIRLLLKATLPKIRECIETERKIKLDGVEFTL